jgi:hypothetical protein
MSLSRPTASRFAARLAFLAVAVVALLGIAAAPAMASHGGDSNDEEGCSDSPLSQPFARFGDNNQYTPVKGGSFESGSGDWSLNGAHIIGGNESYYVAGGSHSLLIQPNGEMVSPAFCVSIAHPSFRFFARQASGSWAVLNVILRWTDGGGGTHETTVGSLQSGYVWKPTPAYALAGSLPLWQEDETLQVRLVLRPERYGGAWSVDDIYIDPRMR